MRLKGLSKSTQALKLKVNNLSADRPDRSANNSLPIEFDGIDG
jgi:hypothetical protein